MGFLRLLLIGAASVFFRQAGTGIAGTAVYSPGARDASREWQADQGNQGRATVTGRVVALAGEAMGGVEVRLVGRGGGLVKSAVTNESGRFVLDGLPPGEYSLHIRALGYHPMQREVSVQASVWMCGNHNPAHAARNEKEMQDLSAKHGCKGWHAEGVQSVDLGALKMGPEPT